MGLVTDGGPAATAPYFDIIVSENALAVGIAAPRSEVILSNDAGAGSTNTKVRNFSSVSNTGTAATGTLDAVNGAYVTINEDGVYGFQWDAVRFTATDTVQITRNSSIYLNPADTSKVLTQIDITAANLHYSPSGTRILRAGDVIRVLTFTSSLTSGNPTYHKLVVTKVSN